MGSLFPNPQRRAKCSPMSFTKEKIPKFRGPELSQGHLPSVPSKGQVLSMQSSLTDRKKALAGWEQMFSGEGGEHFTFPSHSGGLYLEDILATPSLLNDPIYLEVLSLGSKVACLLCKHLFNAVSSGLEGRGIRNPRTVP